MYAKNAVLVFMVMTVCYFQPAWAQVGQGGPGGNNGLAPNSGMGMGRRGVGRYSEAQMDSPFMKEMMGSRNYMHGRMMDMATMNGDADHDFLALMIHHHEGALDMSEAYLKHGKNEKVKTFARGVIAAQKKEIDQMEMWLKEGVGAKK